MLCYNDAAIDLYFALIYYWSKENVKAPYYWPFVSGIQREPVINFGFQVD